jgi:amidase
MHDVISASATALARAIRAKEVSAVEVVQASLQRIAEVNPALNAVVQLCAEAAQAQARAADAALARGQLLGPLHGVPMTIKDSLDTAGVINTGGTQGRAASVPAQDAPVVARLRAAGAILLGKTNTPELTLAGETDNVLYGRTNNSYDLSHTPGGSSGGARPLWQLGGAVRYRQRYGRQYLMAGALLWHWQPQAHRRPRPTDRPYHSVWLWGARPVDAEWPYGALCRRP